MARLTTQALLILAITSVCLLAYGDKSQTDAKPVADWTLNPAERSARLRRLTQSRLTEVSQSAGFSSRFAYEFDQDDQGFIWIGTRNGLDRYDGYEVRNYRHDPSSIASLSSNDIRALAVASNGIVWVGSHSSGLDRFDSATGKAINFRNRPGHRQDIGDDHITEVIVSNQGDIWAGTRSAGLARIDYKTLQVTRYHGSADSAHRLPGDEIKVIFEDFDGRIWVGTDHGLVVADYPYTEFKLANMKGAGLPSPLIVLGMQQSSDRSIYLVAEDNHLLRARMDRGKRSSIEYVSSIPRYPIGDPVSLMMDSNDRLWLAGGLIIIYDTVTEKFANLRVKGSAPLSQLL